MQILNETQYIGTPFKATGDISIWVLPADDVWGQRDRAWIEAYLPPAHANDTAADSDDEAAQADDENAGWRELPAEMETAWGGAGIKRIEGLPNNTMLRVRVDAPGYIAWMWINGAADGEKESNAATKVSVAKAEKNPAYSRARQPVDDGESVSVSSNMRVGIGEDNRFRLLASLAAHNIRQAHSFEMEPVDGFWIDGNELRAQVKDKEVKNVAITAQGLYKDSARKILIDVRITYKRESAVAYSPPETAETSADDAPAETPAAETAEG